MFLYLIVGLICFLGGVVSGFFDCKNSLLFAIPPGLTGLASWGLLAQSFPGYQVPLIPTFCFLATWIILFKAGFKTTAWVQHYIL